jgi:hypothetical protein
MHRTHIYRFQCPLREARLAEFQRVKKEKDRAHKIVIGKIALVVVPLIVIGLLAKKYFMGDEVVSLDAKTTNSQGFKKK